MSVEKYSVSDPESRRGWYRMPFSRHVIPDGILSGERFVFLPTFRP
jgi:hypothetical protein